MYKNVQTGASTDKPKMHIQLYSIQKSRQFVLASLDLSSTLKNSSAASGGNFSGGGVTIATVPGTLVVFGASQVTINYQ